MNNNGNSKRLCLYWGVYIEILTFLWTCFRGWDRMMCSLPYFMLIHTSFYFRCIYMASFDLLGPWFHLNTWMPHKFMFVQTKILEIAVVFLWTQLAPESVFVVVICFKQTLGGYLLNRCIILILFYFVLCAYTFSFLNIFTHMMVYCTHCSKLTLFFTYASWALFSNWFHCF